MAREEPEIKRFKPSTISDHVYSSEFQEAFAESWQEGKALEAPNLSVLTEPFRLCKISNFVKNESFMEELKTELSEVKSRRQSIDLYQFEQTCDLANVESPSLRQLYETFQTDMAAWMSRNTKIELNRKISMSSSCYYDTDYLLCHDDNMGDRRIAFVLYLSKNWTPEDGGSLDLFDTDENGLPRDIVRSMVPEYNSLVFFEVVDNSYHQVAEVTSSEKSRWTINGWFHGPLRVSNRVPRPQLEPELVRPSRINTQLDSWIADSYLYPDIVKEIQKNVELKSYTFLSDFLKSDIYEKLSRELCSDSIKWSRVGPADLRNYEVADEKSLPPSLGQLYATFKSLAVFQLLKEYTELDLVPDEAACMDPKMHIELQRWSRGCYTLICDRPPGYERSGNRDSSSPTPTTTTTTTTNGGSSHAFSRSRRDRRTREGSVSSCENDTEEQEIFRATNSGGKTGSSSNKSCSESQQHPLQQQASCSKLNENSGSPSSSKPGGPVNPDSEDSDVSDIGDYLSDPLDCSLECSEVEEDAEGSSIAEPGALDVIMQFHTSKTSENDTIDYVDPREQEGALIHVPSKDNHLCLVYKTVGTTRLHKYVNHYCKGHFYNLICTYYE